MKILFNDDDVIARKNIEKRIPWAQYGWELIYCAKNGMDALEFMQAHQPDVILTDIKMPVMDGIQMAIIAKDYYPSVKFIFLSGYKDFEYAQQALKLNAIDYLTKPVMTQTLIDVLKKAECLIKQEKKTTYVLEQRYPQICRHFISQLMTNNFTGIDQSVCQALDLRLDNGFGTVGFVDLKSIDSITAQGLMALLKQGCQQWNDAFPGSFFVPLDTTQLFFIFTANHTADKKAFQLKLQQMQAHLNAWLEENLHIYGAFFYGLYFQELQDLYLSYQTAQKTRNNQITDLMSRIQQYIKAEYSNPELTLLNIANHFNINHCYLTSLYKEKYGINLYDYLIQVRMEKAAELLKTTDLKSYQIAELTGYNNGQYFSLSFKKYYGCTVTEFKHNGSADTR
ncbi:MAG: response regulator [Gemmiger sp.]|nr:response regulator [Gemmiger sp.]